MDPRRVSYGDHLCREHQSFHYGLYSLDGLSETLVQCLEADSWEQAVEKFIQTGKLKREETQ